VREPRVDRAPCNPIHPVVPMVCSVVLNQGCQMVVLHTKNLNLGNF
jgi:hypothetical protein